MEEIKDYVNEMSLEEWDEYISEQLLEALDKRYIHIYYQPIIRTINGNLCGMEAFIRWADPEKGMLYPKDFIPALERKKKIHRLDIYIVEEICRKISDAMGKGETLIPVFFNLSQYDFLTGDMLREVENLVSEYEISRDLLNIEITEAVTKENTAIVEKEIGKFQKRGYQVLLDDFGSGHSSFNVFKRYSFNQIKFDMHALPKFDTPSKTIITTIVSMAKKLNIHTFVDGVESQEEFDFLREIGCEKVQGYYFGEPLPFRKSLAHCKEQKRQMEGRGWRNYYDRLVGVDFMADHPLAIAEFDGKTCNYLYANKAFMEVWSGVGLTSMRMIYDAINSPTSLLSRTFSDFQKSLVEGEPAKSIDFMIRGHYMRLSQKSFCEYLGCTLSQVEISDLTQESVIEAKKKDELALRMMYATYETVIKVDLTTQKLSLLVSGARLHLPGIEQLENLKITEARNYALEHFIHKQDRNEYLEWFDTENALQKIKEEGMGYITKYFRTKVGSGDYVWQEHQMFYVPGENCIIYSTKRVPFTERLVNRVSPKHLTQDGNSMDDILWKCLMRSQSINLFWKDVHRRFLGANQKFLDTYGFSDLSAILGKTDEDMHWHIDDSPFQNDEWDVINKGMTIMNRAGKCIVKGVSHDILVTKEPLYHDGKIVGLVGYFVIADGLIESGANERSFKLTDPVTGLLSSKSMFSTVLDYTECWELKQEDFAMISIHIRRFKEEASTYGEKIANALLRTIGATIKNVLGTCATGARLYGGHFAVCMKCREPGDVEKMSLELERQLLSIHDVDGFPVTIYPEITISYASKTEDVKSLVMQTIYQ